MNAQREGIAKTEVATKWENQVINGVFPLRRLLGGSPDSAVFLTEYTAQNLSDVAIKLVPADALRIDALLVQWGAAATVSHPHLIRVFEVGRCHVEGRAFAFVVMEYAEQTLAEVLLKRPLNAEEAREMLSPTLDALAFLHRSHLVHSQLKPSNILVVNDQLKLASDTVRPAGDSTHGSIKTSLYDAPELRDGGTFTAAGDIWSLGITLFEALTRRTPARSVSLPSGLPAPLVDTVQRCLSLTPANRPTVTELQAQYNAATRAQVTSITQPSARTAQREATALGNPTGRRWLLPAVAAALVVFLVTGVAYRFSQQHPGARELEAALLHAPAQPSEATSAKSDPEPPSPVPVSLAQPALSPEAASFAVLHEVRPEVPQAVRSKIRGHVPVTLRVLVDPSGNVVGELLEDVGASRYFARLASEAAAEWKFAPTDDRESRVWLLAFDFDRDGVTVQATAVP